MKLESIVATGGLALLAFAAYDSTKPKPDPIYISRTPTVVGSPHGVEAQLRNELAAANDKIGFLTAQLSKTTDDLRAVRMEKDRLLVKQAAPVAKAQPQVRQPVKSAPPPVVRLPAGGGGACYGGNCSTQQSFRGGPIRRLFGR